MSRRTFAWTLCAFIVALVGLRFAAVATNINNLHTVYPEEQEQATLVLNQMHFDPHSNSFLYYFKNILRTLPPHKQYHGIFLVNNTLVFWLTKIIGWHYYNLHLITLLYILATYIFWALLMHRHFGPKGFVFFSLLTLAEPVNRVCSSLYLIGGHNEGIALAAASFFLVFYNRKVSTKYWFFALFGVFVFFYKGILLLLPILLLPAIRTFTENRQRIIALALFAAGFMPMFVFQLFFGFLSHSLSDAYLESGGISIFGIVNFSHFDWLMWHLPTCGAPTTRWILTALFIVAYIFLYAGIVRHRVQNKEITVAVMAFPLLLLVMLSLANISVSDRYYWQLYPFIAVILAIALSRLSLKIALPLLLGIMAVTLPEQLPLIKPHNGMLMSRYNYFLKGATMNYVPAAEVDFVDWWVAKCPENKGFLLMYQYQNSRVCVPEDQTLYVICDYQENHDKPPLELSDDELIAMGMVLAVRTNRNEAALPGWADDLHLAPDRLPLLREGFHRMDNFTPDMNCPGQ